MSLRSVVKSKVRRSNSRESKKHRKKHHRQSSDGEDHGEDRGEDRSRSREEESTTPPHPPPPPEKMRRKHSEDRSRSDESVGRSARDSDQRDRNRENRRERYDDSDERYSSGEKRKDVKKDDYGEDKRDRKRVENDVDREEDDQKDSEDGERSKGRRDDVRSRGDYDRDDERSRRDDNRQYRKDDKRSRKENERPHKDYDRPKSADERKSDRDEYRSRQDDKKSRQDDDQRSRKENERSNRDDVRPHKDNERSSRDDERSRQDEQRSHRNGSHSRSRRDDDRSRQRNSDQTKRDDRKRDNDENQKRDDVHSKRDNRAEEKSNSKAKNAKDDDNADSFLASKRAKASADGAELMTRTGGAYIPPARLRMMQAQITDKSSAQYQRIAWEALKKSINGLINKINVSNLMMIVRELLQENIVRGRGVLARSIMQAQAASPTFTHVYAALVAIINTKFPNIGELIVKRLIVSFKKGFRRNEKATCLSTLRFIAHLFNQLVCHEVLALQILMLLVAQPTDDSVEVAVGFLKECGNKLKELAPKSLNAVFESLRTVLHEATIDKRVQYMIEVMFAIRKDGFKDHPSVIEDLDIVEEDDQFTHDLKLDDPDLDPEDGLNVFKFDAQYLDNEEKYKAIKKEHLDEGDSDDEDAEDGESGEGGSDEDDDDDDEDGDNEEGKEKTVIIDNTETNLVAFRRTLYLTIQSSLDFEECAHKIRKMDIKPGQEDELCNMILDCCAQQRTYEKFFGLLAQRFCMMEKKFMEPYQRIFQEQYDTVHRLETNKLRNVAKFYAHLLYTDAIEWKVLECIRLNEDDTTSSGRIFIKILFQELSEYMGLSNLNDRLKDVTLQPYFEGLFPRDNPRNTRFAINFFTSIGLGGLTDELRDHLKSVPKQPVRSPTRVASVASSSSSEDESESSSSDSSDSPSSSDSEPSPPVKKSRKGKSSKTPEKKSRKKSDDRRKKSDHRSQKSEKKSLNLTLTAKSSDGPTSMQLRLMKLASYSQLPENTDEVRGQGEKKRDEDTPRSHGRGQEVHVKRNEDAQVHVKRNEDVQVRRRGQESESEDEGEKERRKGKQKADKDKHREDKDRGHKKRKNDKDSDSERGHKRKHVEDSESERGQKQDKRTSKKRKEGNGSSGSEGDRSKGRPNRGEGRERSGDRTKDRKRRHRSRS